MAKKRKSKNYFTKETEDAIIRYNQEEDPAVRSRIYEREIHYPFFKLTQNIIHTFKFYYTQVEDIEHLQHEIATFLLGKMYLYHHSKNIEKRLDKIINKQFNEDYEKDSFLEYVNHSPKITQEDIDTFIDTLDVSVECKEKLEKLTVPKAYSYFGTIVKRWLINYNNKNYKRLKKVGSFEDVEESYDDYDNDFTFNTGMGLSKYIDIWSDFVYEDLENMFKKEKERKIADAVITVFKNRHDLDIFKKKALYIYIREMTDCETPHITKVIRKLKDSFYDLYYEYYDKGLLQRKEA